MYFPKRIPEPKEMGDSEFKVFEQESKKSYSRWMLPLADDALNKAEFKEGKILDVGCGPGLLLKELAQRSKKFQVIGVDMSPYAIGQARKNCKGLNNVVLKIASASSMPFDDESFDLIICKDSIHHFNNLGKVLSEINRVAKPGSVIYLQDLRRDLPWRLLKTAVGLKDPFQKLQYYSARAAYTKKELSDILKKLHIRKYKIKTRQVTQNLKNKYNKLGINIDQLRASFQSRYVAVIKKN